MPLCVLFIVFCAFVAPLHAGDARLIRAGSVWKYYKGTNEPAEPLGAWRLPGFDDHAWAESMSGFSTIAYAPEPGYLPDYGLAYRTLYLRKNFTVTDPALLVELTLRIDYDDGFIAYLNGHEIARRGVPGDVDAPLSVTNTAAYHPRGLTEEIDVSAVLPLVTPGENLLAVQVLGSGNLDYTLALVPELLGNFTRGPYIQNTTSNSTQIIFKTLSSAPGFVELRTSGTSLSRFQSEGATNHVARILGLQPDTAYEYRAGALLHGREVTSDWHPFRTFRLEGKVTFAVLGDSGWGSGSQYAVARQMAAAAPDLIMHVGDLVYYAITESGADFRCLSVYGDQLFGTPMFVALGNHDLYLSQAAALGTFFLPTNDVTHTSHFYSFDAGDVHFVALFTDLEGYADYRPGSPQYNWLEHDLADTRKPWKFLFFHHTWRSSGPHGGRDDYDYNGVPDSQQLEEGPIVLARKYGVQAVFNGHDHDYERLGPSGGVVSFVSGGGGGVIYPMGTVHPDSAQYFPRHHFLKVSVDGDEALVEAVGEDGGGFDRLHLRRSASPLALESAWHTPEFTVKSPDTDGNVPGQKFDFAGIPWRGPPGQSSSAGRLFVDNDRHYLYLGLDEIMLQSGDELLLFLQVPGLAGLQDLASFSARERAASNSLVTLGNLAFQDFTPSIGVVLGDEFGDEGSAGFMRAGTGRVTGQGAFYLREGLPLVQGQKLAQFNHSPQDVPVIYEQNADFIKVALPLEALGVQPGERVRVAGVVALSGVITNDNRLDRRLDAVLGRPVSRDNGTLALAPISIQLAPDLDFDDDGLSNTEETARGTDPRNPDSDGDGMRDGDEIRAGTDPSDGASLLVLEAAVRDDLLELRWPTISGQVYRIQVRESVDDAYHDLADPTLPRSGAGGPERLLVPLPPGTRAQYYRVVVDVQ